MKLARFTARGRIRHGLAVDGGLIDLESFGIRSMAQAAASDALARAAGAKVDFRLADVTLLPPVDPDARLFCVGRNYRDHVAEMGIKAPEAPNLFQRTHDSIVGSGDAIVLPKVSNQFDYEGELAVLIGRTGRHIPVDRALDHVAGYTCFNDGSVRDYQFNGSLLAGKNFERSGSCGPWLVTADEVGDPASLALETRLNGNVVQHSNTSLLIFDVPFIVSYISRFTTLRPGDLIATGTPEGVGAGRKPPLWMQAGDVVEVEIGRLGCLTNRVVAEV